MKFRSNVLLLLFLAIQLLCASDTIIFQDFEESHEEWQLKFNQSHAEGHALQDIVDGSPAGGHSVFEASILTTFDTSWFIQLPFPQWEAKKNTIYRLSMHAKSENPLQISVSYVIPNGTEHPSIEYKEGFTFKLHDDWEFYTGEFASDVEGLHALSIVMNLSKTSGKFYFDNITLEEVGTLDETNSWYHSADSRINEIRKGALPLIFSDTNGTPITEGAVTLTQKSHNFPFGTSITIGALLEPLDQGKDHTILPLSPEDSLWNVQKVAEVFNSITVENHFKWVDFERTKGNVNYSTMDPYIALADSNGMVLRGHALIWGLQQYGFQYHWPSFLAGDALIAAVKERIIRDMSHYKGIIPEYDVWNEPLHEIEFFNKTEPFFPEDFNYWTLMDSAFHWAHSADSAADLYLNEYSVIKGGSTETLFNLVKGMKDRNVPITGIGVQCHFENNKIEPELIKRRLDMLNELDVKIKVTEFDLGTPDGGVNLSELEMASEYAKFLRTTFSHPAVDGVTLWGFWDKTIWNKPNPDSGTIGSGLFNIDKSPKAAADSVIHLLQNEWNSDTTFFIEETEAVRIFYGDYDITIESNGTTYQGSFSITPDSIPASLSLIGDGVNIEKVSKSAQRFSAVTDSKSKAVTVFASGSSKPVSLKVMDLRGRIVYQKTAEAVAETHFSLSKLPAGIYIYDIRQGEKALQQKLLLTR